MGGDGRIPSDKYKWVALSNTTLGMFMASVDASIVIIAMPAIFRGIDLDPLAAGNISYLLWLIMGYLLVTAVLVVALGRLGDIYGRVRIYNLGFALFSLASLLLSLDPMKGSGGALWLIGFRLFQALGGAMLMANSAAILTDAFPTAQRGMALGVNQISALAGQFLGLVAGGVLVTIDWRAVFWINVPIGVIGTIWSYRTLREVGERRPARIDWLGNATFTIGALSLLIAITFGIQPYGGHSTGWTNPTVIGEGAGGIAMLILFCIVETRVAEPMFHLALFRIRAFAAGNAASLLTSIARGGLQFMLIIWLPLHGVAFSDTPLWAGICMLPLTGGFLVSGPLCGYLSDRYGARPFATGGLLLTASSFVGLLFLPVNFSYPVFGLLVFASGVGQGMFSAPNTSGIMGSVPPQQRGSASGMRATFQNSGVSLSIGVFFSLMITGLASTLPTTLFSGLTAQGVPASVAHQVSTLPPVSSLFAAFLGQNPIGHLLAPSGVLNRIPAHNAATLTGNEFFPNLIIGPFHHGLTIVFTAATAMALIAAVASLLRGKDVRPPTRPTVPETPQEARATGTAGTEDTAEAVAESEAQAM
jgi:MFS family permease